MFTVRLAAGALAALMLCAITHAAEYKVFIVNTIDWEVAKIDVLKGEEVGTNPPCIDTHCRLTVTIEDGGRCARNTRIDFTNGKHIFFKPLNVCDPSPTYIAWPD